MRRLALLVLVVLAALVLLVLTRNVVLAPLALRAARPWLARHGLALEVERVSGSWTRSLTLEGVELRFERAPWSLQLALERLSLRGDLLALARGGLGALEQLDALELRALEATLERAQVPGRVHATLRALAFDGARTLAFDELAAESDLALWPGLSVSVPEAAAELELARLADAPPALDLLLSSLALRRPRVALDLAAERVAPPPEPASPAEPDAAPFEFRWPALALEDGRVELTLASGGRLALRGIALHSAAGEPGAQAPPLLTLAADELVQASDARERRWRALSAEIGWSEGRLQVASLALAGQQVVREAWLDLSELDAGRAELALSISLYGGWAVVRGRLEDERVHASVAARELSLGGLLALLDPDWSQESRALVTLEGELDLPLGEPARTRAWLSLRETDLELAGLALHGVHAEARIAEGVLTLEELGARMGRNRIVRASLRTPLEDVSLAERLRASDARLELAFDDLGGLLATLAPEAVRRLGEGWSLALTTRLDGGALALEGGELQGPGLRAAVRGGRVELGARAGEPSLERVALTLEAQASELASLATPLGLPGLAGKGEGTLTLQGELGRTPPELSGSADLALHELALGGHALGELQLELALAERTLRFERVALSGPLGEARLAGALALAPLAARELALEATLAQPRALLARWPSEAPLTVSLGADGERDALAVHLELQSALGDAAAAGELALPEGGGARLALAALRVDDPRGALALVEPAQLDFGPTSARVDSLRLEGALGSLELALALGADERHLALELADFELPAWVGALLPGGLDLGGASGTLRLEGRDAPRVEADLTLGRVRLGDAPALRAEARGRLADGRLELAHLALRSSERTLLSASGSAPLALGAEQPFADGPLELRLELDSPPLEELAASGLPALAGWAGRVEGRVELDGSWSAPRGSAVLYARELAWRPSDLWRPDARLGPATLGLYATVDTTHAGASSDATPAPSARLALDAHLDAPGQVRADFAGRLELPADARTLLGGAGERAQLALEIDAQAEDLAFLQAALPAVRRAEGRASAELRLSGTLAEPRVRGHARVEGGGLRTTSALPSLSGLELELAFADQRLTLAPSTGELGGAAFRVEGSLGPLGPDPQIALHLEGERLLLYRLEGVRVRADADLELSGSLSAPRLAGTLALRDGLYVRNVDLLSLGGGRDAPAAGQRGFLLFSLRDPPLADARFDLRVRSATPFRIDNNLAQASLRPELHVGGTGAVPLLDGRILIDESWISLPSGRMTVESGNVVFDPADPFVPTVAIAARTRLRGYDVRVDVHGPYDRPQIDLVSVPPLPQRELLPLVLTGTPPESGGAETVESAAQELAVFLARDLAGKLFSSDSTEKTESIAERIEFESGRDVTRSGGTTARVSFRIADDLLAEDDSLFLVGERDVYDKINYGLRLLFRLR